MQKGKISKPNEIEICGDIAKIYLTPRNGLDELIAIIDVADVEKVVNTPTRWTSHHVDGKYYVLHYYRDENKKYKTVLLHRLLNNAPEGSSIDHINGNPLDNRRENMRIVTHGENMQNRKVNKNSKTGIRGVYWKQREQRYIARVIVEGKKTWLGSFKVLEDAEAAVKKARAELMPFSLEAM